MDLYKYEFSTCNSIGKGYNDKIGKRICYGKKEYKRYENYSEWEKHVKSYSVSLPDQNYNDFYIRRCKD